MLYQKFVVEIRESVVESMIIKQGKVEIFSQPKEKVKCFYQKVSEVSLSRFNSSMSDEFYIKNLESALKNCTGSNLKYGKLKKCMDSILIDSLEYSSEFKKIDPE